MDYRYNIMRIPKIYLDTTIPNYVFNKHVPDKQKSAANLFERIKQHRFETYISVVVMKELTVTQDVGLRNRLIQLVQKIWVLELTANCVSLGQEYIARGIIPEEYTNDAFHLAIATVYELDFLVSYNFEHLVKIKTIDQVTAANILLGYKTPRIIIPEEVLDL